MFIGAIADDLTGATDLALALSAGGFHVLLVVGVPEKHADFGDADAVVVALKSRTIPAVEAVSQSVAAARHLLSAGARQLLFKYCSTFDSTDAGNIGPVTDALLDLLGESRTLACPAFPGNGRTVYRGHLFVGDLLLSDSSMKDHPLTPMQDANLVRVLQRQSRRPVSLIGHDTVSRGVMAVQQALAGREGIAIVDALCDEDLHVIGRAAKDLKLLTGASGMALGLADNFPALARRMAPMREAISPGRSVILAGSCSETTLRQIEAARAAGMPAMKLDALAIAEGRLDPAEAVSFLRDQGAECPAMLYASAGPDEVVRVQQRLGRLQAGEIVERFLAGVARRLRDEGVNRFLIAGGETSGAVISALQIKTLHIGPKIDPGVPWMFSTDGDEVLALALKSGNFGADDLFIKAWSKLP
ncbi:MAG: four-carbon acid sugar kinase family protein [Lautropia sp.]|nr:four-carbon acid sugar kinase family protein [Lautropia sp.]